MSTNPNSGGGGHLIDEILELRRMVEETARKNNIEHGSRYLEVGVSEWGIMLCLMWQNPDYTCAPDALLCFSEGSFKFQGWPVKVNWANESGVRFMEQVSKGTD